MKESKLVRALTIAAAVSLASAGTAFATPVVTGNTNAQDLADAIAGSGITVTNATFNTDGGANDVAGTFTNGSATVGFEDGIVLTTGTIQCVPGPNDDESCDGTGPTFSELSFDFESENGNVFFEYVFASEEYNEFVQAGFNDNFELLLNGSNIAFVPGTTDLVSIDNVNCGINNQFYRNNSSSTGNQPCGDENPILNLDIQYDGLTTVLQASATGLFGVNTFTFRVEDIGDSSWDSAVFIRGESFSDTPVPAPSTLALVLLGAGGIAFGARRRQA